MRQWAEAVVLVHSWTHHVSTAFFFMLGTSVLDDVWICHLRSPTKKVWRFFRCSPFSQRGMAFIVVHSDILAKFREKRGQCLRLWEVSIKFFFLPQGLCRQTRSIWVDSKILSSIILHPPMCHTNPSHIAFCVTACVPLSVSVVDSLLQSLRVPAFSEQVQSTSETQPSDLFSEWVSTVVRRQGVENPLNSTSTKTHRKGKMLSYIPPPGVWCETTESSAAGCM